MLPESMRLSQAARSLDRPLDDKVTESVVLKPAKEGVGGEKVLASGQAVDPQKLPLDVHVTLPETPAGLPIWA